MANIDKRVVEMKFDNAAFERGVSTTMSTLDKLKQKLNLQGAAKGLSDIGAAGKNISLDGVSKGVDGLSGKFSALQIAGVASLATIASKATTAGASLIKSFTLGPILDGFNQYEKQINATGTIMANVSASGATLKDVTATLDKMNVYANRTIYNFSDMATNLGTFTSAGIKLKPASEAIQGLSNVAAAAGAGTQQAAGAMYQLSQALGRGKVTAQDWNSVVAAGMASSNFQNGLLQTAKAMGTIKMPKTETIEQWTKQGGNFRDAMSKGQITSGVLITTLQAMTGEMTDAQLAQKGYTADQIKSIQAMAKQAKAAAENVKTFTQLKDNLSQGVGSAWASVFKTIFGDINGATTLFTKMSEVLTHIFVDPINSLNNFLIKLKGLGALKNFGDGLKNIFSGIGTIFSSIGDAFREIFPPATGKTILALSAAFKAFTEHLKVGGTTANNIKLTFEGVFSIFKIGLGIVGGIIKAFFGIFGILGSGTGGGLGVVLQFTAAAGSFVTTLQKWISTSGAIQKFFSILTSPLKLLGPVVDILVQLASAIGSLLTGDVSGFTSKLQGITGVIQTAFSGALAGLRDFATSLTGGLDTIRAFFASLTSQAINGGNSFVAAIAGAAARVAGYLSNLASQASAELTKMISSFTSAGDGAKKMVQGLGSGTLSGITGSVSRLGDGMDSLKGKMDFKPTLAAFSTGFDGASSKASGSISTFSKISSAIGGVFTSIGHALSKMGSGLGTILNSLKNFFSTLINKVTDYIKGMNGDDAIAAFNSGILLGLFLVIRNFAKKFGGLLDTFKGIGEALKNGILDSFGQLSSTLKTMQQSVKADILLKIAGALAILVAALYILTKIDPKKLAIALGGLTALFVQLSSTMVVLSKFADGTSTAKMISIGFALLALAAAILILAAAVKIMSSMNWAEMIKGLTGIGLLLAGMTLFTKFAALEKGGIKSGAGLILMAVAINILAIAVKVIGNMDTGKIVKAAIAIDFLLGTLVLAAQGMEGTLKGSAAMLVMATALGILTPVLVTLGLLPYENLGKGLGTVAIGLALLAIAANSMSGALPGAVGMIAAATALTILTPAILGFGLMPWENIAKAMVVLAGSLTILVVAALAMAGAAPGAVALLAVASALAILAPVLAFLGTLSWGTIAKGLVALAGALVIIVAGMYLLTPVIVIMSLFGSSIALLGVGLLAAGLGMVAFSAALATLAVSGAAGFAVLVAGVVSFLAILPLIGKQVGYAFVTFANVIAASAPKLVSAFTAIVMSMLKSLQTTVPEFIKTMGIMLMALVTEITRRAPQIYAAGLNMIVGFLRSLRSRIGDITNLVIDIFTIFLTTVKNRLPSMIESAITMILAFINGLAKGIRDHKEDIAAAGRNLGSALLEAVKSFFGINSPSTVFIQIAKDLIAGLVKGLTAIPGALLGAAAGLGKAVISSITSGLGDLVGLGKNIVAGITKGISGASHTAVNAAKGMAHGVISGAQGILRMNSPSKVFIEIGKYVVAGFAEGITGSKDQITSAWGKMNDLLKTAIDGSGKSIDTAKQKIRDLTAERAKDAAAMRLASMDVAQAKDRLNELTSAHVKDHDAIVAASEALQRAKDHLHNLTVERDNDTIAINKQKAALSQAQKEHIAASAAYQQLNHSLHDEEQQLIKLSGQYDAYTTKIKDAKDALEAAIKTRDDYSQSISDSYSALGAINKDTTLSDYITGLESKIDDTTKFADALQNLKNLGLSDEMYKDLLTKGIDALPFVEQLLEGGKESVDTVNALSKRLGDTAKALGITASNALYQAGVDAAQGLVNGLQSKQAAIDAQMTAIAKKIEAILAQQLKIKSPSRVMAQLGSYTMQGLAEGLKKSSPLVEGAAENAGTAAISAIREAMARMATAVDANMELTPTITPILDLSHVRKGAGILDSMMSVSPISVANSYSRAAEASKMHKAKLEAELVTSGASSDIPTQAVTFIQNNTSPKALSSADIYRRTNNQLSVAKGALTRNVNPS